MRLFARWTSKAVGAAIVLSACVAPAAIAQSPAVATGAVQAEAGPVDVRNVFSRGWMLEDRNGDDVVDFVRARIVLPAAAGSAELSVAANVAARLGYETSALNLDLAVRDDGRAVWAEPVIVIGASNALLARSNPGRTTPSMLAPGEGALSFVARGPVLGEGGFLIEGGDASGLLAAGAYVSGRYPAIWAVRGTEWDSVPARIALYLGERNLSDEAIALNRIVVDVMRPGVSRAELSIDTDSVRMDAVLDAFLADTAAVADSSRAVEQAGVVGQDTAREGRRLRRSELAFTDVHRVDVHVRAPGRATVVVRLLPARPWETRAGSAFTSPASPDFSLGDAYSVGAFYRDTDQDLVPDRTDAYLSVHGDAGGRGLVNLAARMGLETAGMRFPLALVGGQDDRPQMGGFPIVFGIDHYQVQRLREAGSLHFESRPGQGFVEFAPRAFDGRHGLVISGGDAAGLDAAAAYAAERLPYLWDPGKGNTRLRDLETDVRRFFQVRESPGQIAFAVHKLREWLGRIEETDIDSIAVELAVRQAPDGIEAFVRRILDERFPGARRSVQAFTTGFGVGRTIFEQDIEIPWEVDAFRMAFRTDALPKLTASSRGRIEVRVSESPQVRDQLVDEIRMMLAQKGIPHDAFDVHVLSAYKQGYSWLHDAILPRIRGAGVGSIEIRYHTLEDSKEVRWQQIESPTRWLQELFPVDAVMARELGIADSLITFVPTRATEPIYAVTVHDSGGARILHETFSPRYVVRPFFDLFPDYEQIRVTTGWVTVEADGALVLDQRIETDPEAFWRVLQTETYAKIIDYVMDIQDGRPSVANAPFFDELRVELTLSEPNYRIGIDEEVISSVEALHEDIYFETLTLFDLIGGRFGVPSLSYPGRVLPYIQPPVDGRPGRARITFTGKERGVPRLTLTHRSRGREPVRQRYDLATLPVDAPRLRGVAVDAGADRIAELLFDVVAIDSIDRFAEYRERASEDQIDRTFLPAPLLAGMVSELNALHGAGLLRDALAWDRVDRTSFRFVLRDTASDWLHTERLARSARPKSTRRPILRDADYRWRGERIVQWQTPIPPVENDSILARLSTFPGVDVYWIGESFLGQDIFAADFLPPQEARYVSQAKLNALKPTLLLSGRQHANEVSSTSHVLRLGELLATDSSYRNLLHKVNVVLHPITNPDGARLAWEMQRVNPDFMLHAGYLGALGVDATSGAGSDDPIYPESKVRPELQETWLPDISMNLHGYPSHEWVQLFAGYSAWVRSRTGTQRTWWAPRGWFIPGFSWIDDARYPNIKTAQFAILDSIAAAITSQPDIETMNRRLYARYQKYGKQDVENFREYFHNGILVYSALRGREATGPGPNNPRITYFSLTTEAPDETARGEWLEMVASAGLAHTSALLRYLTTGVNVIERQSTEYQEFVTRSVARKKPVVPPPPGGGR
jgi:hypothetical protein